MLRSVEHPSCKYQSQNSQLQWWLLSLQILEKWLRNIDWCRGQRQEEIDCSAAGVRLSELCCSAAGCLLQAVLPTLNVWLML